MTDVPELRFEVPSAHIAARLLADPLPDGLRLSGSAHHVYRDTYFDTHDGEFQKRGMTCRIRTRLDDRRFLLLELPSQGGAEAPPQRFDEEVPESDPVAILAGASGPARRLRAVVDPDQLMAQLDLTIERTERRARTGLLPLDRLLFSYDTVTARRGAVQAEYYALGVSRVRGRGANLRDLARQIEDTYDVRRTMKRHRERADEVLEAIETRDLAQRLQGHREVTVIALEQGRLALAQGAGDIRLPFEQGSGEAACREVMRAAFDSTEGQLALLGTVPATETRPTIEVWLARRLKRGIVGTSAGFDWFTPSDLIARAGSPVLRDPRTLAALSVAARSDLLPEWTAAPSSENSDADAPAAVVAASRQTLAALRVPFLPRASLNIQAAVPDQFFNADLSWLEFNLRVLGLAEDPNLPLLERVRFVSIFCTNLDEFFRVKIAGLKLQVHRGKEKPTPDGLRPREALEALSVRLRPLIHRQYDIASELLQQELPKHGIHIRRWEQVSEGDREKLRHVFENDVLPLLTPKAITMAPGHPFPYIEELQLSLAVSTRDPRTGTLQFSHVRVPDALPRFVPLRDGAREFVPLEDLIRAFAELLYSGRGVEGVHPFRLTRMGDLDVDEQAAASFAQAIEEEVQRRSRMPVVRIEVERDMPDAMRGLLLRELKFEERKHADLLADADVYPVGGLVNLGALSELADLDVPELHYNTFEPASPFPDDRSMFDVLDEGDVLVHHPYERFDRTLQRFIEEAAADPDVPTIKLTLYRPGGQSSFGDALKRAAAAGKEVSVFVELKARFDEERNLVWVKQLEQAGIHVVTGLVRLKTHAKIALIVRRNGGKTRRYVHIGTGNYNPVSARLYTDVGLFTADETISGDLAALFNDLTGSSGPPRAEFKQLLVSPTNMLERFLAMIRREIEHVAAGRRGHIRAKMNALSDLEIIAALYEASQLGVDVDLVIRGICTLRPGVPNLSERIRVVGAVGRFLEHGRIYWFQNGGEPEVFIGSADWRPRNLRRRVEVVTPVRHADAMARLDHIIQTEIDDPTAFELQSDGSYLQVTPPTGMEARSAQETFVATSS